MKQRDITLLAIFFIGIITIIGCGGPDKPAKPNTNGGDSVETVFEQPDTVLFWIVDSYKKTKSQVYKDTASITAPQSVINGINSIFPDIPLKFEKQSGDTVYATIDSSYKFSNDMGSSGAQDYLSTVVINLTTIKNVNFVNLQFPPGSHAAPGIFSRKLYEKYTVVAVPEEGQ